MNLYLISQAENCAYDTYDSAVVAAPDEDAARLMHPNGRAKFSSKKGTWGSVWSDRFQADYAWCKTPEAVTVNLIGTALPGTEPGVICASFNAG